MCHMSSGYCGEYKGENRSRKFKKNDKETKSGQSEVETRKIRIFWIDRDYGTRGWSVEKSNNSYFTAR